MSAVDNTISLTITRETKTPSRAGFGTPLILAWGPSGAPSQAVYTDTTGMTDDGWAATDPAVLCAEEIFSQNPKPSQIKVIKKTSTPQTQTVEILPRAVSELTAGDEYKITIGGAEATYTVGASDTQDDVVNGIASAINALSVAVTASPDTGNDVVDVTSDSAGDFFAYEGAFNVYLLDNTSKSGSEAADLSNAENLDPDWYVLLCPQDGSQALIAEWASEIESRSRLYVPVTADYSVPESDGTSTTSDVISSLVSSAYERTIPLWHHELAAGHDGAITGRVLPTDPGSITWQFKTFAGVPVTKLHHVAGQTGFTTIDSKGGNFYREVKGLNLSLGGMQAPSGEYADVMRGSDWLHARIQENVLALFANADKVPITDDGVDQVVDAIFEILQDGIDNTFLAEDPTPTVTAPKVADISATDKGNRLLPDVDFEATLAGAVHKTNIAGRLVL